ncbi:hypothetical protein ACFL4Y_02855 [Gemmatimonadota bacterium]
MATMKKTSLTAMCSALAILLLVSCETGTGPDTESIPIVIDQQTIRATLQQFEHPIGMWEMSDNKLWQIAESSPGPLDTKAFFTGRAFEFLRVEANLTVTEDTDGGGYAIGILSMVQDAENLHYVYLGQSGELALAKLVDNNWSLIHSESFDALPIGVEVKVRMDVDSDSIDVYTDDQHRFSVQQPGTEFSTGYFGFLTGWGAKGRFRNIVVTTLEGG